MTSGTTAIHSWCTNYPDQNEPAPVFENYVGTRPSETHSGQYLSSFGVASLYIIHGSEVARLSVRIQLPPLLIMHQRNDFIAFLAVLCREAAPFRERCAQMAAQTGVSLDIENYCTVSLFFEQAYL
ncbi:hypothetical protein ACED16_19070 [Enterobacter hormaechei]